MMTASIAKKLSLRMIQTLIALTEDQDGIVDRHGLPKERRIDSRRLSGLEKRGLVEPVRCENSRCSCQHDANTFHFQVNESGREVLTQQQPQSISEAYEAYEKALDDVSAAECAKDVKRLAPALRAMADKTLIYARAVEFEFLDLSAAGATGTSGCVHVLPVRTEDDD